MTRTLKSLSAGLLLLGALFGLTFGMAGGAEAQTLVTSGLVRQYESGSGTYQDAAKATAANKSGQTVSVWADTSGSSSDALPVSGLTTPVYQPYQFGPQPGIVFGGGSAGSQTAADSAGLAAPGIPSAAVTVVSVQRVYTNNNGGSAYQILSNNTQDGSSGFQLSQVNAQYQVTQNAVANYSGGASGSAVTVTTMQFSSGGSPAFRVNGASVFSGGGNYKPNAGSLLGLGCNPYSANGANVSYGAVLVYSRLLTSAETTQDELYLSNKYYGSVPGTTTPPAGTPQTFPLSSVSRQGSWSILQGSPQTTALNSTETQLAVLFTGTRADIDFSASTGINPAPGQGLTANIDGADFDVPIASSYASGQNWLTVAQNLPDGPHRLILRPATPAYNPPYGWSIDATTPIRVYGASPACAPLSPRPFGTANVIYFVGNSRTQSYGNSGTQGATLTSNGYPYQALQLLGAGWSGVNEGTYSELQSAELTRFPSDVAPQYNPANSRSVLVLVDAVNDLDAGQSVAQVEQTTTQYVAAARAKGWREIILPTTAYDTANASIYNVASINAYNTWLKANYSSIGGTACPDLQAVLQPSDYISDGLHFTDGGDGKLAAAIVSGINNQVTAVPPLSALSFSEMLALGSVTFTAAPVGGTSPYTYTLTRPGMTTLTSTTGTLTDTNIAAGRLNVYTLSVTDSATTPLTKSLTQTVAPMGAIVLPLIPNRQPSRGR